MFWDFWFSVSCDGNNSVPGFTFFLLEARGGTADRRMRFEHNEPVLKSTELLFHIGFTFSPPTASASDASFSRAAAAPPPFSTPRRINDTISPAALMTRLLMWFHGDAAAPHHCFPRRFVAELIMKHRWRQLESPRHICRRARIPRKPSYTPALIVTRVLDAKWLLCHSCDLWGRLSRLLAEGARMLMIVRSDLFLLLTM